MSNSSILTYLTSAQIRDDVQSLDGEVLTRPALLKTDGSNLTWACDVRISGYDDPLRNVPVAMGNRDLVYAEVGQAVKLTRNAVGRFEVTGFAKTMPGKRVRIPVNLDTYGTGAVLDMTLWVHKLTLEDLSNPLYGAGFGQVAFGAYAVFRGNTLIAVRY